jgi:hypothetical protein
MMQTDEKKSSSSDHYNFIAKLNHWITAVLVLTNLALGLHMEHFPGYGTKHLNGTLSFFITPPSGCWFCGSRFFVYTGV